MTVSIQGVDKVNVYVQGVNVKQALSAANETVNKGLYDATTLSAVDADLATGNIKSGITMFGKVGSASVLDVSDADAAVTDVKSPKTFYSVTGPKKTGTMATVALNPALNSYPAGYHAGAASLTAVDADLATGNIKSGVTIFGVAGAATVQDISAANATVAQVLAANTFFSVTGAIKTGTMPTVTIASGSNAYPTGYHAGAAGLSTIEASLAAANIKSGINIFGFVGTLTPTVTELYFYAAGGAWNYSSTWSTLASGSVPATAKKVLFSNTVAAWPTAYTAELQVLYNSVQRLYLSQQGGNNLAPLGGRYSMDGLGTAADALLQVKVGAGGGVGGSGGCWYVT